MKFSEISQKKYFFREKIRRIFFWNIELSPLAVSFPEGAKPWKSMKIKDSWVLAKKNIFGPYVLFFKKHAYMVASIEDSEAVNFWIVGIFGSTDRK